MSNARYGIDTVSRPYGTKEKEKEKEKEKKKETQKKEKDRDLRKRPAAFESQKPHCGCCAEAYP